MTEHEATPQEPHAPLQGAAGSDRGAHPEPHGPGAKTGPQRPHRSKRRRVTKIDTDLLELADTRIHEPQRVAASRNGMVSTAHYSATAAGVQMLARGGNAVDAAVAAALALGVCEPRPRVSGARR